MHQEDGEYSDLIRNHCWVSRKKGQEVMEDSEIKIKSTHMGSYVYDYITCRHSAIEGFLRRKELGLYSRFQPCKVYTSEEIQLDLFDKRGRKCGMTLEKAGRLWSLIKNQ